jgi:ribosomal protein S12 methylthiotransferase
MPLQHVADDMLRAMRRERSGTAIRRLVRRIRARVPGIALRSAFIVGFPGETEAHVDELCDFLEEAELDRVGVFRYSREEGTHAAELRGHLPEAVKRRRWERVMETQARVAARRSRAQVGRTIEVLVEREGSEPGTLLGRSSDQAPEIDGVVHLRGDSAPGTLVLAKITDADTYDLHGEIVGPDAVDRVAARL